MVRHVKGASIEIGIAVHWEEKQTKAVEGQAGGGFFPDSTAIAISSFYSNCCLD